MLTRAFSPRRRFRGYLLLASVLAVGVFVVGSVLNSGVSFARGVSGGPSIDSLLAALPQTTVTGDATKTGSIVTINNCIQPPSNVDHATFTDAQLAKYGMPLREQFQSAAVFDKVVRADKHRDCQAQVGSAKDHRTQEGAKAAARANKADGEVMTTSSAWGGYVELAGNWSSTIVDWAVPNFASCDLYSGQSYWGGLGGYGNVHLTQSGTDSWCDGAGPWPWEGDYEDAWVENYGNQSGISGYNSNFNNEVYYATNFQPNIGDQMVAIEGGNSMYVGDSTQGTSFSMTFGPKGDQQQFDAIDEYLGLPLDFADMNTVNFSYCEAFDANQGNWLPIGNPGSTYYDITLRYNGTTLASTHSPPNSGGTGNFTVRWLNYN